MKRKSIVAPAPVGKIVWVRNRHALPAAVILLALCSLALAAQPIIVSCSGDGGPNAFKSVQAAIDSIPDIASGDAGGESRVILIKPGEYKEVIKVSKGKRFLTLKGDGGDPTKVVITSDMNASFVPAGAAQPLGPGGSASGT